MVRGMREGNFQRKGRVEWGEAVFGSVSMMEGLVGVR